jgi:hypothetical protein
MDSQPSTPPIDAQIAAIVRVIVDFGPSNYKKGWTAERITEAMHDNTSADFEASLKAAIENRKLRKLVSERCPDLVQEFRLTAGRRYEIHFATPLLFTNRKNRFVVEQTFDKENISSMLLESLMNMSSSN